MNNALKYVKILESTGVSRQQAEAHIQMISEILEDDLATKQDIKNLEASARQDSKAVDNKLDTSFQSLEQRLKNLEIKLDTSVERLEHKLLQSEYRMTIKLGSIVTVVIAAATAVIKLL
jgi:hypothetical protein